MEVGWEVGGGRVLVVCFSLPVFLLCGTEMSNGLSMLASTFLLQSRLTCFLCHRSEMEGEFCPITGGPGAPPFLFQVLRVEPSELMRFR